MANATKQSEQPRAEGAAGKLQNIRDRIQKTLRRLDQGIDADKQTERNRIAEIHGELATVGDRAEAKETEVKTLLADGKDATAAIAEWYAIRKSKALLELEISGRQEKLSRLDAENFILAQETLPALYHEYAELLVAPIVPRWNAKAAELAELSKELVRALWESHQVFGQYSATFVQTSHWDGFERIARLGFLGEPRPADFFYHHDFSEEEMRRRQALAAA